MELGLRLGDATPSKASVDGVNKSLGFCMALGMNPSNDHDDDDKHDDDCKEDHVIVGSSQRIFSMNPPPVQLDLLPSAPVLRHNSFPWSSDNGSSEGGSSGKGGAGRGGHDVKRMLPVGSEEATSSSRRLEFMAGRISENNNNHNDTTVVVERGAPSDEDEHGIMSRKKLRLSKEQSAYLEESFKEHTTLNPKQKLALAEQLHLRPRQVEVWFQNRRARTKLKQTEVDFEYLKKCCETLTDENRRLHKELQELRALKTTSTPFYLQHPATTLTMCPSCERVATTSTAIPPPSSTTSANHVEHNPKKTNTPLNLSPKPKPLTFPVSPAPPS